MDFSQPLSGHPRFPDHLQYESTSVKAPQDKPYISLPATGSFAIRMSPESDSVI
jgi:hypothetical protein